MEVVKITIKSARVNVGLSQKEAADRLGISNKTLGNWENGITFPPADKIPEICELYGVSYDNLNFLPSDSLRAKV
jgi:transcriptional regulator with XRE-family HTH domain